GGDHRAARPSGGAGAALRRRRRAGRARPARGDGLPARALAAAQPLLRRRVGGRAPPGRARGRRRVSAPGVSVRRAQPGDAAALVALAEAVGGEPEGWLISDSGWRPVGQERRYLRAVRRHPDAAVFVAEADGEIVGRLSVARDPHPASRHVADLGLMVAARYRGRGIGRALLEHAVVWARGGGVT